MPKKEAKRKAFGTNRKEEDHDTQKRTKGKAHITGSYIMEVRSLSDKL